jgi:hypothetical protein
LSIARPRRPAIVLDSIDQALLASDVQPDSDAQSHRNVRNKRVRLMSDRPRPAFPGPGGLPLLYNPAAKTVKKALDEDVSWTDIERFGGEVLQGL